LFSPLLRNSSVSRPGLRFDPFPPIFQVLFGNPDFYFHANNVVVFVDGCFWHGCPKCGHTPKTNSEFWKEKVRRNRARDHRNNKQLRSQGKAIKRFWEHELDANVEKAIAKLAAFLDRSSNPRDGRHNH
jgi:DNA mismatch endonuclease (patch repair protein)